MGHDHLLASMITILLQFSLSFPDNEMSLKSTLVCDMVE